MATTSEIEADLLVQHHVDWDTYCRLRDDESNNSARMTYRDGELVVMSAGSRNGIVSRRLFSVVMAVARASKIPFLAIGSTTLRRQGRTRLQGAGKEPDEGFYLGADVARIRGMVDLDLTIDPPPNLAIEVDNSADSALALPAYARVGVPEVWIHDPRNATIGFGCLVGDAYETIHQSVGLPRLSPALVLEALGAREGFGDDGAWLDWLEAWARELPLLPLSGEATA